MKDVADELRTLVDEISGVLFQMRSRDTSSREHADMWSKKEILGHLIDSAANNQQRFIRAACEPTSITHHTYSQNDWVRIQKYNERDWDALVTLWSAYNYHISAVIEHLPADVLGAQCDIGKAEPVSLAFVIRDYLRHVRHHVDELLPQRAEMKLL